MRFPGDANFREYWRRQKRLQHDPVAAMKAHVRSSESIANPLSQHSDPNLLTDPIAGLAQAEEQFRSYQVNAGQEILRNGQHVETAADEQNVRAAMEQQDTPMVLVPDMAPQPEPARRPYGQHRYIDPWNDSFSTVPGGFGFDPLKPPGWFPGA